MIIDKRPSRSRVRCVLAALVLAGAAGAARIVQAQEMCIELAADRWSDVTGGGYVRTGDYTLLNLQVQYRGAESWEVAAGASNLLDENFEFAQSYLEAGRNVYVRLRVSFYIGRVFTPSSARRSNLVSLPAPVGRSPR